MLFAVEDEAEAAERSSSAMMKYPLYSLAADKEASEETGSKTDQEKRVKDVADH